MFRNWSRSNSSWLRKESKWIVAVAVAFFAYAGLLAPVEARDLSGSEKVSSKRSFDPTSVSSIRERMNDMRALYKEKGLAIDGPGKKKFGYLGALEYYLAPRAYPFDSVNWKAYKRATLHKKRMPVGRIISKKKKSKHGFSVALSTPSVGESWEFLGPTQMAPGYRWGLGVGSIVGRVNTIAYAPANSSTIYLGGAQGGVWKTVDGGINWSPLTDSWENLHVSRIAIDPTDSNIVYAGTGDYHGFGGYSLGIMKSTDGGSSWVNQGKAQFGDNAVSQILIDPENPSTVIAITGRGSDFYGKVWRSANGGTSWSPVIGTSAAWSGGTVTQPDQNNVRAFFAVGSSSEGGEVWRSENGGSTWTKLTVSGLTSALDQTLDIAASKIDPKTVYLISSLNEKIWKSTDRGDSWTDISAGFPTTAGGDSDNWSQSWYDYHITVSGNGETDIIYVGLLDLVQSTDGGQSWRSIGGPVYTNSSNIHTDQHCMAINPSNPNEAIVGNDGGVYKLTFNPSTKAYSYSNLNGTLGITQFYDASWHPTLANTMIGGAQDNSSPYSRENLQSWINVGTGDGGYCAINRNNPQYQVNTWQYGGVLRTTNAWITAMQVTPVYELSDRVLFIPPLTMDLDGRTYIGTNYLYRLDYGSSNWVKHVGSQKLSSSEAISAIAVSPSNRNYIYTGSADGELWMSANQGISWENISSGTPSLPNRAITSILVNPSDPKSILVTVSGTGTGHLWQCTDTSAGAGRVWLNKSGSGGNGLPDIPANTVAVHYEQPDLTWFIGTDIGVFMTTDAGATWADITSPLGLPNVEVRKLEVNGKTGYLNAATFGRGMWRIALPTMAQSVTNIECDPTTVKGGAQVAVSLTISSAADPGGFEVSLTNSSPSAAIVPTSVVVPEGQTTASFVVQTKAVISQKKVTVTANPGGKKAEITVNPSGIASLTIAPDSIQGGEDATGTVVLDDPAPARGAAVYFGSSRPSVARGAKNWILVPAGQTTASFKVKTFSVLNDTGVAISAKRGGMAVSADVLVLSPGLDSISASIDTSTNRSPIVLTVTLNGAASSAGATVLLKSSAPKAFAVPSSVKIPKGKKSVSISIKPALVATSTPVTITATRLGVNCTVDLTIDP